MSWNPDLSDLNLPPDQQQQQPEIDFELDPSLAMFTNDQFFDYDTGPEAQNVKMDAGLDFTEANMQWPDVTNFANFDPEQPFNFQPQPFTPQGFQQPPSSSTSSPADSALPIDPVLHANRPQRSNTSSSSTPTTTKNRSASTSSKPAQQAATGAVVSKDSDSLTQDESARVAAEEDKRRRNTAASARFRVKKKQREQATERKANDLTSKVEALENRIKDLEKENGLLKGLLTERERSEAAPVEEAR